MVAIRLPLDWLLRVQRVTDCLYWQLSFLELIVLHFHILEKRVYFVELVQFALNE